MTSSKEGSNRFLMKGISADKNSESN